MNDTRTVAIADIDSRYAEQFVEQDHNLGLPAPLMRVGDSWTRPSGFDNHKLITAPLLSDAARRDEPEVAGRR